MHCICELAKTLYALCYTLSLNHCCIFTPSYLIITLLDNRSDSNFSSHRDGYKAIYRITDASFMAGSNTRENNVDFLKNIFLLTFLAFEFIYNPLLSGSPYLFSSPWSGRAPYCLSRRYMLVLSWLATFNLPRTAESRVNCASRMSSIRAERQQSTDSTAVPCSSSVFPSSLWHSIISLKFLQLLWMPY